MKLCFTLDMACRTSASKEITSTAHLLKYRSSQTFRSAPVTQTLYGSSCSKPSAPDHWKFGRSESRSSANSQLQFRCAAKAVQQYLLRSELCGFALFKPFMASESEPGSRGYRTGESGCGKKYPASLQGLRRNQPVHERRHSNYNALQARMQTRFTKGGLATVSYTWSQALSNGSAYNYQPQDSKNLYADYGPANFNQPKILSSAMFIHFRSGRMSTLGTSKLPAVGRSQVLLASRVVCRSTLLCPLYQVAPSAGQRSRAIFTTVAQRPNLVRA